MTAELALAVEELIASRAAHNVLCKAVVFWVDAQTRLVQYGDAPMWPQYEAACVRWNAAIKQLDEALP